MLAFFRGAKRVGRAEMRELLNFLLLETRATLILATHSRDDANDRSIQSLFRKGFELAPNRVPKF